MRAVNKLFIRLFSRAECDAINYYNNPDNYCSIIQIIIVQ